MNSVLFCRSNGQFVHSGYHSFNVSSNNHGAKSGKMVVENASFVMPAQIDPLFKVHMRHIVFPRMGGLVGLGLGA